MSVEPVTVRCPSCEKELTDDGLVARCEKCATAHHAECFSTRGTCAIEGCGERRAAVAKGYRAAVAECAECGEPVHVGASAYACKACPALHHAACFGGDECSSCSATELVLGPAESRAEAAAPVAHGTRCARCIEDVSEANVGAVCSRCGAVHHPACFDVQSACARSGCGGRAAFVGKEWRVSLGECARCKKAVHADGNVLVCRGCDALHHPACFEKNPRCGSCSEGQAVLVAGRALHAAGERASTPLRASLWALNLVIDNVWLLYVAAFFWGGVSFWVLLVAGIVLSPVLSWAREKLRARRLAPILDAGDRSP